MEWRRAEHAIDAARLCLAVDVAGVTAVAQRFADARRRRLVLTPAAQWDAAVRDALTAGLRSVTLVVPGWHGDNLDATLLEGTLRAVRRVVERSPGFATPWGVLTGTDPADLERTASKIIAAGDAQLRDGPSAILVAGGPPSPVDGAEVSFTGVTLGTPASLRRRLLDTHWNALCFVGHGRSYCACDGWLCAARSHLRSPRVPLDGCLSGYDCVDPEFERVDPRRYDADLMLLDTCGALNLAAASWDDGYAPVAMIAAQSPALAVIASDGLTQEGSPGDLVAALAEPTMGGVALCLNALRREHNLPCPYMLLGDPDMPRRPLQDSATQSNRLLRPIALAPPSRRRNPAPAIVQLTRTVESGAPGFWPWELWDVGDTSVDAWDVRCPLCGRASATRRTYLGADSQPRVITACARCGLVDDLPRTSAYAIELAAPQQLAAGQTATVELRIIGLSPDARHSGGVTVVVSGPQSRVQVRPTVVPITEPLCTGGSVSFALHAGATARSHLYYLRAIARVDDTWLWASRPLSITRSSPMIGAPSPRHPRTPEPAPARLRGAAGVPSAGRSPRRSRPPPW
jgi:hypothetical protein